ncbi:MAG: UDP-N-acetylmuramate dehydrogenase [Longicatena sp.]
MNIEKKLQQYADVESNVMLSKHTTFRIGGKCKYFIYPKNELCLLRITEILKEEKLPYKVFGKGSNILCSDDDYEGAILCLDRYFTDFNFEEDGTCIVQSGASIILLAHEAMKHSFSGLEFASGIPGTLGGAVYMNAGAYKSDISQIMKEVYVFRDNEIVTIPTTELEYKYRHSAFQTHHDWIILGCRLQLEKGVQQDILDLMNARRKRRMDSQPLDKPCAGSMFRNPEDYQAWELIEKIGMRGLKVGGAMISDKHANFIINENNAKANDVLTLIEKVQEEVKKQFNIELITEVEKFNWKI